MKRIVNEQLHISDSNPIKARAYDYKSFTYPWHFHGEYEILYVEKGYGQCKTVTASSSTYTVEVVAVSADPGASAKANYVDIIPVIKAKDFSSVKTVTINKDAATYQKVDGSSDLKVNVIIPFTKGETKGIIVLQLSGDHLVGLQKGLDAGEVVELGGEGVTGGPHGHAGGGGVAARFSFIDAECVFLLQNI